MFIPGPTNPLEEQIETFTKEVTELRTLRAFADNKIRALIILATYHDNVIDLLANRFRSFQTNKIDLNALTKDVNYVIEKSTETVADLSKDYPSLEELVTRHVLPKSPDDLQHIAPQTISRNSADLAAVHK